MQRQTPKQIKQAARARRYQRVPGHRMAGALSTFSRVESPDCNINFCNRARWIQPTTEPEHFIGEKWTSQFGRVFSWEFVDINIEQQFCELHHRDVMIRYLFRQLRLGVI